MVKRLTKIGSSLGLVIEKPILDLLGANADTPFDITTDGQALILTPVTDPSRQEAFRSALDKTNKRYAGTLKKLAE